MIETTGSRQPCMSYPVDENVRFDVCCYSPESPYYFCHECDYEWNKEEAIRALKWHHLFPREEIS